MDRSNATMHARPGAAPRKGGALLSLLSLFMALPQPPAVTSRREQLAMQRVILDDEGSIGLGPVMALVGVFVGFIVIVTVAANFVLPIFTATADVNEALNDDNVTTGDASADSIKPVFGIVIGLAVVLGFVGLILAAVKFGKK